MNLKYIEIGQNGQLTEAVPLSDHLRMIVGMTAQHFENIGFIRPWIGYVTGPVEHPDDGTEWEWELPGVMFGG